MGWFDKIRSKTPGIKFPKRFGNVFASLLGSIDIYDDNLSTYLIEGYQQNDIVYGAVNYIADSASKARWYLKDSKTGKELQHQAFENLKKSAAPQKTLKEVLKDGIIQNLVTGNAYYTGEYGKGVNKDYFNYIYVIPSENMQIRGSIKGITSYYPNIATGFEGEIPAAEVLHIKTPNPIFNSNETTEWLYGQSPLRAARLSIQTYNESKEAGVFFTANKGAQKAIVLDKETNLGTTGQDDFKNRLRATGQGRANNNNIPVLQGVDKVIDLGGDPKKALVLEQRMQAAQEICNVLKFPSSLLGLKDTTYQNAKEAKKGLWENAVMPQLDEIADGFNRWTKDMYGPNVVLAYDISHVDALKEDRPVQDLANIANINEARVRAGLDPTTEAWGNERYIGFTQSVINEGNDKGKKSSNSESKRSSEGETK